MSERPAICMVYDEFGNAFACFDFEPEALEAEALRLRKERGEVTTVTIGPSPFVIQWGNS